jgi:hypothetical protein
MVHQAVRDSNSKEGVSHGRLAILAAAHGLEKTVPSVHWFMLAAKWFLAMNVEFKAALTLLMAVCLATEYSLAQTVHCSMTNTLHLETLYNGNRRTSITAL